MAPSSKKYLFLAEQFCKNLKFKRLKYTYFFFFSTQSNGNETSGQKKNNPVKEKKHPVPLPEEPTTCCMSGCANCVWLDYAEKLCKYYQDGGEQAIKEINERISDPNIKAYIMHEIRMRNKK